MRRTCDQQGFTAFEGFLVLLVVSALAGAFYFVSHRQLQKMPVNKTSVITVLKSTMTFEKCAESGGSITKKKSTHATGEPLVATCKAGGREYLEGTSNLQTSWSSVADKTVKLTQYKLQIMLPESMVSTLLYRFDGTTGAYFFAPKAAVENQKCYDFLNQNSGIGDNKLGARIEKINPDTGLKVPYGIISYHAKNFGEYYVLHKAAGGNYFESGGVKYYKVGDNFYTAGSSTVLFSGKAFNTACPGVSGKYITEISNEMGTLKVIQ